MRANINAGMRAILGAANGYGRWINGFGKYGTAVNLALAAGLVGLAKVTGVL